MKKTRQENNVTDHTSAVYAENKFELSGLMEKTWISSFPKLDQVRNMHNYPRIFINIMHNKKIAFLYFKRIQKVLTKTIP